MVDRWKGARSSCRRVARRLHHLCRNSAFGARNSTQRPTPTPHQPNLARALPTTISAHLTPTRNAASTPTHTAVAHGAHDVALLPQRPRDRDHLVHATALARASRLVAARHRAAGRQVRAGRRQDRGRQGQGVRRRMAALVGIPQRPGKRQARCVVFGIATGGRGW